MRLAHDPVMRMIMKNFIDQEHETERSCSWIPATNIKEDDQAFRLEMAVPGRKKEDFAISLEKDILTVSTVKESNETSEGQKLEAFKIREFGLRDFSRSFSLPENVDKEAITAEYLNGILTIVIPKMEVVQNKKEIQVA
jgi:HSP20 family protein